MSVAILVVLSVFTVLVLVVSIVLYLSARMDMNIRITTGENNDDEAANMLVDLIGAAQESIIIHDDGDNTERSVYNDKRVLEAFRNRLKSKPELEIKCLFNDNDDIEFAKLTDEFKGRVSIWHSNKKRPEHDVHYKIVDDGRIVYLSEHRHGESEREFEQRETNAWPILGTRSRISRRYTDHFEEGILNACALQ